MEHHEKLVGIQKSGSGRTGGLEALRQIVSQMFLVSFDMDV